jgi:malonate transporter MadL subunit
MNAVFNGSRGRTWLDRLTGSARPIPGYPASVLVADAGLAGKPTRFIAVVPDPDNPFPRARNGEVGLLAACHLLGIFLGDLLGAAMGVKTNVGGVGIAMLLLILSRLWLHKQDLLPEVTEAGVGYWAAMYIPVVVAMAATQNVVAALRGGPVAVLAALGALVVCAIALINRMDSKREGRLASPSSAAAWAACCWTRNALPKTLPATWHAKCTGATRRASHGSAARALPWRCQAAWC